MSRDDLERLVTERSLVSQDTDDGQITGYWAKAVTSYSDARSPDLSPDGALQLAYTASLQATFAVLAASGFRVKSTASHYKAFYAMQKLDDPALRQYAIAFDDLRQTRHLSIYEPEREGAVIRAELTEALATLGEALPAVRSWLVAKRPSIKAKLAAL